MKTLCLLAFSLTLVLLGACARSPAPAAQPGADAEQAVFGMAPDAASGDRDLGPGSEDEVLGPKPKGAAADDPEADDPDEQPEDDQTAEDPQPL